MESLTSFHKEVEIITQINDEDVILKVSTKTNQKIARKRRYNEVSHIINITRFQTLCYVLFFCFMLVTGFFLYLERDFLVSNKFVVSIYLLSFLFLWVYFSMAGIFIITIMFQITYRTRCLDFFIQFIVYSQFVIVNILLFPLILLYNYNLTFNYTFRRVIHTSLGWDSYIGNIPLSDEFLLIIQFIQLSHIFWIISFLILVIARRSFRKPIFWLDSLKLDKHTIITQSATEIYELEDGYSQRPLFLPFTELSDYIHNIEVFHEKFQSYARFIARRGELIDWSLKEKSIVFYPRFSIQTPNFFLRPISLFKFWYNLRDKKELTTVELHYITRNLSIRLSSEDNNMLEREVTLHLLLEKILQSLKESMIKFLEGDFEKSYNVLLKI
ncbi:MAG: hypothetical protein ACFE9L_06015 [Candidatus Hodarchaeota archaeon]